MGTAHYLQDDAPMQFIEKTLRGCEKYLRRLNTIQVQLAFIQRKDAEAQKRKKNKKIKREGIVDPKN